MGMLISGKWSELDVETAKDCYERSQSTRLISDTVQVAEAIAATPGRFVLIASFSCPWSHRATIMRMLKRLENLMPVHMARGDRVEGYAVDGGAPWPVPGTGSAIAHLHELYTLDDRQFTGKVTVPVLWDAETCKIACNDSAQIMRLFDTVTVRSGGTDVTFAPEARKGEIDSLNGVIHEDINNGVYRAGFAGSQAAFDEAVNTVFARLDALESRLAHNRFLLGNLVTESDWRLFPTLVRFDAIYYVLHRCCKRRLADYPNLWAYARDLHGWDGISRTVDMDAARAASYQNDTPNNPHGIIPPEPDVDWSADPGRDRLGPAVIARRDGSYETASQPIVRSGVS